MEAIKLNIEGIPMIVNKIEYSNGVLIEFCTEAGYNDPDDYDCYDVMLGFKNPIKALKDLGNAALELAKAQTLPVFFTGKDAKRHRVYGKMLKSAGINVVEDRDVEGDLSWKIIL